MNFSLELEIRDWLARYIDNTITLTAFRDWFVPATWDVERSGERGAEELSAEIELRFAEYSNGHRSEEELKDLLRPYVSTVTLNASNIRSGSSTEAPVTLQPGWVNTRSAAVSA
jgi:hypothetical protein